MKNISNLFLVFSFAFFGLTIIQSDIFEDELIVDSQCWICDALGCTNAAGTQTGVTDCEDNENSNPPCSFDGDQCGGVGTPVVNL